MLQIISIPLGWIMSRIYDIVGNYGIALILFTLVTKLLLLPLAIKQKKSMIRMNAFQPLIQNIQKKYANDPAKQNEELARLQNEHGFSTTAGCLPFLIQMPVLFGLIDVIYKPLRYIIGVPAALIGDMKAPGQLWTMAESIVGSLARNTPQIDIIKAIAQKPDAFSGVLSADIIAKVQSFDFTFLGLDLTATPSLKIFNALLLIPVLSVGSMLLQQVITMKFAGNADGQAASQQKTMLVMTTVMFAYFSFVIPAGVSIYWIFSSIFGIIQEVILHQFINPEKEKAKIENEIMEARKARKEQEKQRREKQKTVKGDKYVEDTYASEEEAERVKQRLAKARALDKEKYGE